MQNVKTRYFLAVGFMLCIVGIVACQPYALKNTAAAEKRISLPAPEKTGGKTVLEALWLRKSTRTFSEQPVTMQNLSNLLWAAWGINRAEGGYRTVPTGMNKKDAELYVALDGGVWRYNAASNELELALDLPDVRARLGGAPITLLYAATAGNEFSGLHVGSMYQSAALYCAAAGIGNVVKRDRSDALSGILALPAGYKIFIIQLVGMPK
ncbi:MAG: nitroreductase family protein [Acidaminococcales bacterium]|nr:nitroreductase family protein [Acidaminococcales bacterium]